MKNWIEVTGVEYDSSEFKIKVSVAHITHYWNITGQEGSYGNTRIYLDIALPKGQKSFPIKETYDEVEALISGSME